MLTEIYVVKILCAILLAFEIILFSYRYVSVHCCCLEYIIMLLSRWRCKVSCSLDMYTALWTIMFTLHVILLSLMCVCLSVTTLAINTTYTEDYSMTFPSFIC